MDGGVTTYLLTQGVLGVAVLALSYVVAKLYSKTEKLQLRIEELHQMRLDDARSTRENMEEIMRGHNKNLEDLTNKFEIVQGVRR